MKTTLTFNQRLFLSLNSLAQRDDYFDKLIIFCAKYLIFFLLLGDGVFLGSVAIDKLVGINRWQIYLLNLLGILVWLLMLLIKMLYFTPRPYVYSPLKNRVKLLIKKRATSGAFPSGHTALFFAAAGAMLYINLPISVILFIAGSVVGVARVIAGIHWPIDILGGAVLGYLLSFLIFGLFF